MLKRLKKIVLWLGAVLILPLVVFIGLNWRDETPSPLSKELSWLPENNVPDEQNAFYAMMGLNVAPEQSMTQAGRHLIDAYRRYERITPQEKGIATEFAQAVESTNALQLNGIISP